MYTTIDEMIKDGGEKMKEFWKKNPPPSGYYFTTQIPEFQKMMQEWFSKEPKIYEHKEFDKDGNEIQKDLL